MFVQAARECVDCVRDCVNSGEGSMGGINRGIAQAERLFERGCVGCLSAVCQQSSRFQETLEFLSE